VRDEKEEIGNGKKDLYSAWVSSSTTGEKRSLLRKVILDHTQDNRMQGGTNSCTLIPRDISKKKQSIKKKDTPEKEQIRRK